MKPRLHHSLLFFILLSLTPQPAAAQAVPDQSVMSVLWVQRSAEYRALCYQAFNCAELRIGEYLKNRNLDQHAVVIFDIDETLLDNSPEEAENILEGRGYSEEVWQAWVKRASAEPVPGSLDFCHFLARNDIHPIYLSNRSATQAMETLANLQKWNFPYADRNHLYLKADVSSKEFRRTMVARTGEILMLVGDNLSDFAQVFEDRSVNFGYGAVDSLRTEFGKRFIVLPNPIYGDWTKPLKGDRKKWLRK